MSTRTALLLVGTVVLLLAGAYAFLAWAFGGLVELAAFAAAFAVMLGLLAGSVLLVRRATRR